MNIYDLFFCYGLTFAIMNKIKILYNTKINLLNDLIKCSYCVGFHSGWICFLFKYKHIELYNMFYCGLMAAAFCYVIDNICIKLESN